MPVPRISGRDLSTLCLRARLPSGLQRYVVVPCLLRRIRLPPPCRYYVAPRAITRGVRRLNVSSPLYLRASFIRSLFGASHCRCTLVFHASPSPRQRLYATSAASRCFPWRFASVTLPSRYLFLVRTMLLDGSLVPPQLRDTHNVADFILTSRKRGIGDVRSGPAEVLRRVANSLRGCWFYYSVRLGSFRLPFTRVCVCCALQAGEHLRGSFLGG